MQGKLKLFAGVGFTAALVLGPAIPAFAASTTDRVVIDTLRDGNPPTSDNPQNDAHWYREDTRVGGGVQLYKTGDNGALPAPGGSLGNGALALTTNSQNSAKAQLMTTQHVYGTPVADITGLDYSTYMDPNSEPQNPLGSKILLPSFQLQIDTDGDGDVACGDTACGFTTLVYEPYQNGTGHSDPQPAVATGTWQAWDATNGDWWSSKAIHCTGGTPEDPFDRAAGAGGPPFTRPSQIATECPNAIVLQVGLNMGSFNPNAITAADGLHFATAANDYTWDFGPK
jgi:hypothetical protein